MNSSWSNVVTRQQSEVASKGHAASEGVHKLVSLKMDVAQHFGRVPPADNANDVSVDAPAGHCLPMAQRMFSTVQAQRGV
jgi:hypothetical protein